MLCFSATERCILMWSHYAEQHRGVVLGFDASLLEAGYQMRLGKVQYSDDLPEVIATADWIRSAVYGLDERKRLPDPRCALTKHFGWHYEREWRLFRVAPGGTLGDYDDVEFARRALSDVIVGCRADNESAKELFALALAVNPDVRYSRVKMNPFKFELEAEAVSMPRMGA